MERRSFLNRITAGLLGAAMTFPILMRDVRGKEDRTKTRLCAVKTYTQTHPDGTLRYWNGQEWVPEVQFYYVFETPHD